MAAAGDRKDPAEAGQEMASVGSDPAATSLGSGWDLQGPVEVHPVLEETGHPEIAGSHHSLREAS